MIAPFMFIVLVLFGHGMGIGEYFNDNLWTWDDAPLVCGLMSDYDKQMASAFGAWKSALLSIDDKWDITFILIDPSSNEDFEWCEAYVIVVAEEHTDHAATQGSDCCTWGIVQTMGTNKLVAYIFEERDIARFNISFEESMERTIKHEVGHIFGLGHWQPKGMADAFEYKIKTVEQIIDTLISRAHKKTDALYPNLDKKSNTYGMIRNAFIDHYIKLYTHVA